MDIPSASPFLLEVEAATGHVEDDPKQAYWGEVNEQGNNVVRQEVVEFTPPQDKPAQARVPKARDIPNKVVLNTTGAHCERWQQATSKELNCLKTAWTEPTPEFRSRYSAAKKNLCVPDCRRRIQSKTKHLSSKPLVAVHAP